jgi:hypothetical protein
MGSEAICGFKMVQAFLKNEGGKKEAGSGFFEKCEFKFFHSYPPFPNPSPPCPPSSSVTLW